MKKRLTVNELLRYACDQARMNIEEWISCMSECTDEYSRAAVEREKSILGQLIAYRNKRWGESRADRILESGTTMTPHQVMAMHNSQGDQP